MINLIRRYQSGDIAVREKLVEKNVDLVQALSRKFCESDVAAVELYRIGWIGFWKAVDGFDPQSGIRFSTCAVPQIGKLPEKYEIISVLRHFLRWNPWKSNTRIQQQIPNDTPVHFGQGYH